MSIFSSSYLDPRGAVGPGTAPPQVRFLVRMTYPEAGIIGASDLWAWQATAASKPGLQTKTRGELGEWF